MKLEFENKGTKFTLDFEKAEQGFAFELRIKESDGRDAASLRKIENGRIKWSPNDDFYISKEDQDTCDRMIKLIAFA